MPLPERGLGEAFGVSMSLYGYGEDGRTLMEITERLDVLLRRLGDDADPAEAVCFYRPSFGRGNRYPKSGRTSFGEFDAILGTAQSVYLIESKYSDSAWSKKRKFRLEDRQRNRHAIFRWYLEKWRERPPKNWADFVTNHGREFTSRFPAYRMPAPKDSLATQLTFVLKRLEASGAATRDVLLVFARRHEVQFQQFDVEGFRVLMQPHGSEGGCRFFEFSTP